MTENEEFILQYIKQRCEFKVQSEIAKNTKFSELQVLKMVENLAKDGYVILAGDNAVSITEKGIDYING